MIKTPQKRESSLNRTSIFLLIALIAVIDALYIYQYGDYTIILSSDTAVLNVVLDILLSWMVLIFALLLLSVLIGAISNRPVKMAGKIIYFLLLFYLSNIAVFAWYFYSKNGYAPSAEVISFILENMARAPQHILQTSPLTAVLFVSACLLFTSVFYSLSERYAQLSSKRHARALIILLAASFSAAYAYNIKNEHIPYTSPVSYISKIDLFGHDDVASIDVASVFVERNKTAAQKNRVTPDTPVIFVMIESLRHDLMQEEPSPFPFMRELTKEGIFFDRAYASASHSNYADLAFWYSRYPLRTLKKQKYPRNAEWRGKTIFSVLKDVNYKTAYISSQNEKWGDMINWLDTEDVDYFYHSENYDGETWVNEDDKKGLVRLMQKGIATAGKIEDSITLNVAKDWIRSLDNKQQFVLGLNLQNTHFSYVIPEGGEEPFQPSKLGFSTVYYNWPKENKENVRNRYFNAVYNLDKAIRNFVAFLKTEGIWDKCIFVIVGDSGEAFYEHGFGNHSGPMYDEVMRTYAFMKPTKKDADKYPAIYKHPMNHIDFVPAVLDMLGVKRESEFQGVSPFSTSNRTVYMHTNAIVKQHGIVKWPWKLLSTYYPSKRLELYNLVDDPFEHKDLSKANSEKASELDALLESWVAGQIIYYSDSVYYRNYYPPYYE